MITAQVLGFSFILKKPKYKLNRLDASSFVKSISLFVRPDLYFSSPTFRFFVSEALQDTKNFVRKNFFSGKDS